MKILVITQNSPLYLASAQDRFFEKMLNSEHELVNVVIFPPYSKSTGSEIINRLKYYGIIDFIKMAFHVSVNTLLSYLYYVFPVVGCYSAYNVVKKYNLSEYKTKSINSKKFIEYLSANEIDLVISLAAPKIFKKDILSTPKYGCINCHFSLLPKYRGLQSLFWAMLNDEKAVGISVHEMDDKIDNGPIFAQMSIAFEPEDSLHSLFKKVMKNGPAPDLLIEAIDIIKKEDESRIHNDPEKATYFSFPGAKDGKLFRAKGKKFF